MKLDIIPIPAWIFAAIIVLLLIALAVVGIVDVVGRILHRRRQ
jgi:hypothetical protein